MHFQLVIKIQPLSRERDQVTGSLASFASRAEALPGCMSAGLYADARHKGHFVFIEEWASRAALDAHLRSEGCRKLWDLASGCAGPPEFSIHQISQTTDAAMMLARPG
jgi:quinol monooxygenase YgiN